MKCASCDNEIVIKTDPENRTYEYKEGIRKHEQDFEPEEGDHLISAVTDETRAKLLNDPIFRLQHAREDQLRTLSAGERMQSLADLRDERFKDDAGSNSSLRKLHRARRHADRARLEEGRKRHMSIALVDADPRDDIAADAVDFRASKKRSFDASERMRKVDIQQQSIFGNTRGQKSAVIESSAKAMRISALRMQAVQRVDVSKIRLQSSVPAQGNKVLGVARRTRNNKSVEHESSLKDAVSILSSVYSDEADV
jgi:hypothetical protein